MSTFLLAAMKLGQGNIFTSVCLSMGGSGPGGSPIFRWGLQFFGGLQFWGVSNFLGGGGLQIFLGVSKLFFPNFFPQNFFWDVPPLQRWSMRGQYASYWNAFLLCMQTCRMFADVCSVCTILFTFKLSVNLNLHTATLATPDSERHSTKTLIRHQWKIKSITLFTITT